MDQIKASANKIDIIELCSRRHKPTSQPHNVTTSQRHNALSFNYSIVHCKKGKSELSGYQEG